MVTFTSGPRALEFLLSEANGTRSRETVIIDTGDLIAGTVLGKITASGKYVILAPGAADGSQNAAGVLAFDADATSADVERVAIVRDAEVRDASLTWPGGITGPQKTAAVAALAALGVIVR